MGTEIRNGAKYQISQEDDRITLIVKGIEPRESGEFTCEIVNSRGRDSCTAKLVVQSKKR